MYDDPHRYEAQFRPPFSQGGPAALEIAGHRLTHVLHLTSLGSAEACRLILGEIAAAEASLESFSGVKARGALSHEIAVAGIGSAAAQRLAARLARLPSVSSACVEHRLQRLERPAAVDA